MTKAPVKDSKREALLWCKDGTTMTLPEEAWGFRDPQAYTDEEVAELLVKRLGLKVTVATMTQTTVGPSP